MITPEIEALRRVMTKDEGSHPMRVAIITPYAREPEEQLRQCHESVIAQTHAATHILVADGSPAPFVSGWNAEHIALPVRHDDCGDTPRAIGAMSAIARGFDAIAFLDADNWITPDHVATMLELHASTGAAIVIAARALHRLDGSLLRASGEGGDGVDHVDTNCLFLTSAAYRIVPVWALVPKRLHVVGDRLVWSTIQALGYKLARATRPTVAYRTAYRVHYEEQGEAPPAGAKDNANIREALAWWRDLPDADRKLVFRRLGLKV